MDCPRIALLVGLPFLIGVVAGWLSVESEPQDVRIVVKIGCFEQSTVGWHAGGDGALFQADLVELEGAPNPEVAGRINSRLARFGGPLAGGVHHSVEAVAEDFLDSWRAVDSAPMGGLRWWWIRSIQVIFLNGGLLTLRQEDDIFAGGAHQILAGRLCTFDLRTGYSALSGEWLDPMAARRLAMAFIDRLPSDTPLLGGAGAGLAEAIIAGDASIGVVNGGVMVHVPPYVLSPFSVGALEHFFSWEDFRRIISEG